MTLTTSNTRFGANLNQENGNIDFRLFSKNGTAAILCIFDSPKGKDAILNIKMNKNGDVFEASFNPKESFKDYPELRDSIRPFYYGYRVFGPNYEYSENWYPTSKEGFKTRLDNNNNRFNPNKLAYDPYGLELSHLHSDVSNDLLIFRSNKKSYFDDNQRIAPKTVFRVNDEVEIIKTSKRALKDEIIGEVHLKSLTILQNKDDKGTYKAAGEFADKIKALGVTMVEFLPLYEFDDKEDIGNYWGYMPLCYFAPHKKYAFNQDDGKAIAEFREMVNEFHKRDIKVCLDVVYNHTGEARIYNNEPKDVNLFCYALIDNNTYYKADSRGYYAANSGCHNDANTAGDGFQYIIVDSLEYWIRQGVDAFRFDLATSLMDTDTGVCVKYDKDKSIIGRLKDKLQKRGIKVNNPDEAADGVNLIAEPWTCSGPDAYKLGNFPEFFAEWNDTARNNIRAFSTRPHSLDPLSIRHVITGTPQKFTNPFKSINYVSCHDGFTLWDLNSYDKKSAETCGGSDWELCSSYKGDKTFRDRAIRNQMALLALSAGCFMVQIDDIVLHSKGGNNNSYNIDGPTNYIDFDNLDIEKQGLSGFIKSLIDFRKDMPILRSNKYVQNMDFFNSQGVIIPYEDDTYWLNTDEDFLSFISGNDEVSIYAAFNKGDDVLEIILPDIMDDKGYYLVFDTKNNDFNKDGVKFNDKIYKLEGHTAALMIIKNI